MRNNVLIIDSDLKNCKQIKYSLHNANTNVYYIHSVLEALALIKIIPYSLIIMDVLLSEHGGVEVLCEVREIADGPLLILSEQASSAQRVLAIKCGADDVLTKPFDLEECLARSLSLMHRFTELHPIGRKYAIVGSEALLLDTTRRMVSISGKEIKLTKKEYEILLYMLVHRKQILTCNQIFDAVWNNFVGDASVIPYHVHNLRKKLGDDWIESVYGVGYRMREPV